MLKVIVFGNVALDVICRTVNDVPRHDSIVFDQVSVSAGGCGSNVAIGLAALGIPVALVARVGEDDSAGLVRRYWERVGVSQIYLRSNADYPTGVSVGLVDSQSQPRFVHTSGANKSLVYTDLDVQQYVSAGARNLHVAGFFVLPGILNPEFGQRLQEAHQAGLEISLDVVRSVSMRNPGSLWNCLPAIDFFFCNAQEAEILTGLAHTQAAAQEFRRRGAGIVIIKLGEQGCWLESAQFCGRIAGESVQALDTTGAGDAFAAGFLAARVQGADVVEACQAGNAAGSRMLQSLGAVSGWFTSAGEGPPS